MMRRRTFVLLLVLLAALLLLVQQLFERHYLAAQRDEHRQALGERVSGLRFQLESTVANNLALVNSLAAFISAYPDFTPDDFRRYAAQVLAREPALVNLAAAPDMVVRHVYPLIGNEAVLGLDYLQHPEQRRAVEHAIDAGELVLAGPVELVQGGQALIGRAPVYVQDQDGEPRLWGIVSAPMLLEYVHAPVRRFAELSGIRLALRSEQLRAGQPQVFHGDPELFENDLAVVLPVRAGPDHWQLAAVAGDTHAHQALPVRASRIGTFALALALMLGFWRRRQQQERRQALEQRIQENERFLRAVEGVSLVGGWRLEADGCFSELSPRARELFGLVGQQTPVPLEGLAATLQPDSVRLLREHLLTALRRQHVLRVELPLQRHDGRAIWLLLQGEPIGQQSGSPALLGAVQDITRAREQDSLIHYQANYDALTDLPNRSLFLERLASGLWQARRDSTRLAVLFLDLDNFKSVNDNLGHDAGDELLVEVGRRLRASVREQDTLARYSGDEFVAVLPGRLALTDCVQVAERLVAAMAEPFSLGDRRVHCTASVGLACFPDHGDDVDTLLIKADQAMYAAKRRGRNGWQLYSAEMQAESEQQHRLYNDLLVALEQDALQVHYQPLFDTATQQLIGCEALVRWQHAGSWISPEAFVSVAEERGVINRLDSLVLARALDDVERLQQETGRQLELAVNVSPRLLQMRDDYARGWLDRIRNLGDQSLTVEITERMLVQHATSAREILAELHGLGVQIAIDDFGTGYSGLGYLTRFPVQAIKIDRSFVSRVGCAGNEESLIESMVQLASRLRIRVIAEGVETPEQVAYLRNLGCDAMQGFGLARPMPIDDLIARVQAQH